MADPGAEILVQGSRVLRMVRESYSRVSLQAALGLKHIGAV